MKNDLIQIIFILVIFGFGMWMVNRFIPMIEWVKALINGVAAILVIIWLLEIFGFFPWGVHYRHGF